MMGAAAEAGWEARAKECCAGDDATEYGGVDGAAVEGVCAEDEAGRAPHIESSGRGSGSVTLRGVVEQEVYPELLYSSEGDDAVVVPGEWQRYIEGKALGSAGLYVWSSWLMFVAGKRMGRSLVTCWLLCMPDSSPGCNAPMTSEPNALKFETGECPNW
jgi:hypothetical protein